MRARLTILPPAADPLRVGSEPHAMPHHFISWAWSIIEAGIDIPLLYQACISGITRE
jgi:hypothetical protein